MKLRRSLNLSRCIIHSSDQHVVHQEASFGLVSLLRIKVSFGRGHLACERVTFDLAERILIIALPPSQSSSSAHPHQVDCEKSLEKSGEVRDSVLTYLEWFSEPPTHIQLTITSKFFVHFLCIFMRKTLKINFSWGRLKAKSKLSCPSPKKNLKHKIQIWPSVLVILFSSAVSITHIFRSSPEMSEKH